MDKSPEAFRTISEVAEDLDLPQHVLRFWETRFAQIKPLKRGGGRRYYRPDDVDLLKGIRYYLYGEGYTIKGVQRILKERGLKHVCEMGRAQTENFAPPVATIPRVESEEERRRRQDWPEAELPGRKADGAARQEPLFDQAPLFDDGGFEADEAAAFESPRAAAPPAGHAPQASRAAPASHAAPTAPRGVTPPPEPARSPAPPPAAPAPPAPLPPYAVGRETGRRLQTALFELLECKRILDATR